MGNFPPLCRDQRRTLARLSPFLRARGLYLAGGVAVAVHRQHRRSMALDFFSLRDSLDLTATRDALVQNGPPLEVVALTDASLRLRIGTTPVDIVSYPYALLTRPVAAPEGGRRRWRRLRIRDFFEERAARALAKLTAQPVKRAKRRRRV